MSGENDELKRLLSSPSLGRGSEDNVMAPPLSTNVPKPSATQSSTSNNNPQASMTASTPATGQKEVLEPVIQNVVSTVNLETELNLMKINACTRNSEYNPARFIGLVMRIRNPRATALIFRSGKLVCTGARCEEDSHLATRKFARIIQKIGFHVKFKDFKIQNIVATCDLKFPIKLESLCESHGNFTSYEPELYPGLIYRLIAPRIVLLIFVNGKIVMTGAKDREDLTTALSKIYTTLLSYRKK
ncbi:TATA-box-binding protein 2 [Cotesia glomerata]|uniref:TATA-box-binding protein n=1 Tax=Cotesia glomerata TaxID=32391 RepID=A0AAV7I034_COTGL|nr:TATA-box-binding protein 2 [Cotesia glomerata]XP_044575477.1 TATA-box-binding protein 2 [Cotesia glomerata]KAH0539345.1 hypothetical protein KQX54_004199 [Cotesia glomerata]